MDDREARRRARANWPGEVFRLGHEASDSASSPHPSQPRTIEENVATVWALTLEQWHLTGKPLPT